MCRWRTERSISRSNATIARPPCAYGNHGPAPFQLAFAPAFAPVTELTGAEFNGAAVNCPREESGPDWHARCAVTAGPGESTLTLRYRNSFGYSLAVPPPQFGRAQLGGEAGLGRLGRSEPVTTDRLREAWPTQRIDLFGAARVAEATGAQLAPDRRFISFAIPGAGSDAVHYTIRLRLEK